MVPLISSALLFSEIAPRIKDLIYGQKDEKSQPLNKSLDLAQEVVSLAQKITQKENPNRALKELQQNPELYLQFQQSIVELERDSLHLESQERMSARDRDVRLASLGRLNRRADIMVIAAALGLVSCLGVLGFFEDRISGEAVGILSTISGVFGACLKDAFSFEFGRSRESHELLSEKKKGW